MNIYHLIAYPRGDEDILLCPSARVPSDDRIPPGMQAGTTWAPWLGSPSEAWKVNSVDPCNIERVFTGSYGFNGATAVHDSYYFGGAAWQSPDARGASNAPLFFDCASFDFSTRAVGPFYDEQGDLGPPPEYTDFFLKPRKDEATYWVCMDRHHGGINMVFLDASVRKVGLKEPWTLKWHRRYNTANRWTQAGGVPPQDRPKWMRSFKDY